MLYRQKEIEAPSDTSANPNVTLRQLTLTNKNKMYKRHIQSVKIFLAITITGFLSYVPASLGFHLSVEYQFLTYTYFCNHINNPLVYLALNKTFRNDVIALWAKAKRNMNVV